MSSHKQFPGATLKPDEIKKIQDMLVEVNKQRSKENKPVLTLAELLDDMIKRYAESASFPTFTQKSMDGLRSYPHSASSPDTDEAKRPSKK